MRTRDLAPLWTASLLALAPACDTTCDRFCSAEMACTPAEVCVPVDPDVTKSACVDACNAGLDNSGFDDCISCAASVAADGCRSSLECPSCTDQIAYENDGPAFAEGFYSKAREEDFLCTNGRNLWTNGCTYWDLSTDDAQGCTSRCSSGWEDNPRTVGAECSGPVDGAVVCTCTLGKNSGATFELAECSSLLTDGMWTPCNL